MIVDDIQRTTEDGLYEISARLRSDHELEVSRLWFRFPEHYAPAGELDASPFLAGTLVWCLRHSEDLTIDGPVSPLLLGQVDEIAQVLRSFFPGSIRPIAVRAAQEIEPPPAERITASLFTRGLDSWYGVLAALDDSSLDPPITHTVYCPTLNAKGWSDDLREAKVVAVREASARVGLELIRLDTNANRVVGHVQFAMALALGFANVLIASGEMRGGLIPRGTHPDLDFRFSTGRTRVIHYGDASRMQKAERIARSQDALDTLNVCKFDYLEQDRNCGRCEKCVRTMLELHILGVLDRCPVFEVGLELDNVAAIADVPKIRNAWLEIQSRLGDGDFDRQLAAAVRMVIFRSDLRFAARRARRLSRRDELAQALGDADLLADVAGTLDGLDQRIEARVAQLR